MDVRAIGDRLWPVFNRTVKLHVAAYRATGGRIGHGGPQGATMLLLDHVGAKSGTKRTTPLMYVETGSGDVAIIASKGGHPKNPAWFHNLRANPDTTVQIKSERRDVRAREATGEERDRLFDKAASQWSDFATYQKRTERKIPVVVLEKRA
jgi:deazaflavin-dependent oxidoreductase (nitroreductase family)